MPRFRATTTIVHKSILEADDGQPVRDVEQNAIEDAVDAIANDALDVIYAVELERLPEEGEG